MAGTGVNRGSGSVPFNKFLNASGVFPPSPILFATFGDSLTDMSSTSDQNLTSITAQDRLQAAASASSVSLLGGRMAVGIMAASAGKCVPVANCGIGGTRTDTMILRDTLAYSASRKAIADAYNLGASILIVSAGTNDIIQQVTSTSTAGQITGYLAAYYANLIIILKRASALFPQVILTELMTIDYAADSRNYANINGLTAADVAAQKLVFDTARAYIAATIIPMFSNVRLADNYSRCCDTVNKTFKTGMSLDGLHLVSDGGLAQGIGITNLMLSLADYPTQSRAYAPLPAGAATDAGYGQTEPTFAVVAGGYGTGFSNTASGIGTSSNVPSVVEINNVKYQQYLYTPLTYNGSARTLSPGGYGICIPTIQLPVYGASPVEKFNAGDLLRVEMDILIDDGAGGIPNNVLAVGWDINLGYNGTFFTAKPIEENALDSYLHLPTAVIKQKLLSLPMAVPRGSLGMTNAFAQVQIVFGGSLTPFRVLINNVRVVKVPKPMTKPVVQLSSPATGATVVMDSNTDEFGILNLTPAGTLATLTVSLPVAQTGIVDRERSISSTQIITALTVNSTSTVYGAPTSMAVGDCITFREIAPGVWSRKI